METITPGAGLTLNFFLKWRPIKCLAVMIAKIAIKKIIRKVKTNTYYVLIAKPSLLNASFEELIKELRRKIDE